MSPDVTTEVALPFTGEVIDLHALTTGQLAGFLADLRDAEGRVRDIKRAISEVVHARMDEDAAWTVRDGGWKITGRSPAPVVEWDVQGVVEALDGLVAAGDLTATAASRAIQETVTRKVVASGIGALMKIPGVAERLEPYRTEAEPAARNLTVSRA